MLAAHRGKGEHPRHAGRAAWRGADQAACTSGPTGPSATSRRRSRSSPRCESARCFQTDRYSVGDRGLHAVTERPREGDTISLPRYLALSDAAARRVTRGLRRRARRRHSRLFQIPQDARRSHSSLLRRSRPAGRRRALCRSRAPGRHCAAARAAHRSRLRIGAERRWSGRNSKFSPQLRRTSSPAPPAAGRRRPGGSLSAHALPRGRAKSFHAARPSTFSRS